MIEVTVEGWIFGGAECRQKEALRRKRRIDERNPRR